MPDFIWRKIDSECVFAGPMYSITRDRLAHPLGKELDYYVIRPKHFAAGVVPVDEQGRVLLVQQWRHPVEKLLWSIPAGSIDPGETPQQCALRELREEAGYAADHIAPLYTYHPSVGSANQIFHLFIATNLRPSGQPDPAEITAAQWFTREQVETMIQQNDLVDGLALVALLMWLRIDAGK